MTIMTNFLSFLRSDMKVNVIESDAEGENTVSSIIRVIVLAACRCVGKIDYRRRNSDLVSQEIRSTVTHDTISSTLENRKPPWRERGYHRPRGRYYSEESECFEESECSDGNRNNVLSKVFNSIIPLILIIVYAICVYHSGKDDKGGKSIEKIEKPVNIRVSSSLFKTNSPNVLATCKEKVKDSLNGAVVMPYASENCDVFSYLVMDKDGKNFYLLSTPKWRKYNAKASRFKTVEMLELNTLNKPCRNGIMLPPVSRKQKRLNIKRWLSIEDEFMKQLKTDKETMCRKVRHRLTSKYAYFLAPPDVVKIRIGCSELVHRAEDPTKSGFSYEAYRLITKLKSFKDNMPIIERLRSLCTEEFLTNQLPDFLRIILMVLPWVNTDRGCTEIKKTATKSLQVVISLAAKYREESKPTANPDDDDDDDISESDDSDDTDDSEDSVRMSSSGGEDNLSSSGGEDTVDGIISKEDIEFQVDSFINSLKTIFIKKSVKKKRSDLLETFFQDQRDQMKKSAKNVDDQMNKSFEQLQQVVTHSTVQKVLELNAR